jgi:hypothetical protein
MIQPLRTVHRGVFVALALLLPALLLAGLGARRSPPRPDSNDSKLPASARLVRKTDTFWQRHQIQTAFYGDGENAQSRYVVLRSPQLLNEPDLLLYIVTSPPQGNTLPAQPRLLGPIVEGETFVLPRDAQRTGRLVLYSEAHQEVVDVATEEQLP